MSFYFSLSFIARSICVYVRMYIVMLSANVKHFQYSCVQKLVIQACKPKFWVFNHVYDTHHTVQSVGCLAYIKLNLSALLYLLTLLFVHTTSPRLIPDLSGYNICCLLAHFLSLNSFSIYLPISVSFIREL